MDQVAEKAKNYKVSFGPERTRPAAGYELAQTFANESAWSQVA